MTTTNGAAVTQEDREAAADWYAAQHESGDIVAGLRFGKFDWHPMVKLLSAHRIATLAITADRERELTKALERIRDRDWTENALDPQWPADLARTSLAKGSKE